MAVIFCSTSFNRNLAASLQLRCSFVAASLQLLFRLKASKDGTTNTACKNNNLRSLRPPSNTIDELTKKVISIRTIKLPRKLPRTVLWQGFCLSSPLKRMCEWLANLAYNRPATVGTIRLEFCPIGTRNVQAHNQIWPNLLDLSRFNFPCRMFRRGVLADWKLVSLGPAKVG